MRRSTGLPRVTASFFALTPDRVLRAVEQAGFAPSGHCTPLTCLENRVYDVRLEEGRPRFPAPCAATSR